MPYRLCAACSLSVAFVLALLALPPGCSTDPAFTEVGKLDQHCFADMTCDEGLICIPLGAEGGIDGGQCFLPPMADTGSDSGSDSGG